MTAGRRGKDNEFMAADGSLEAPTRPGRCERRGESSTTETWEGESCN